MGLQNAQVARFYGARRSRSSTSIPTGWRSPRSFGFEHARAVLDDVRARGAARIRQCDRGDRQDEGRRDGDQRRYPAAANCSSSASARRARRPPMTPSRSTTRRSDDRRHDGRPQQLRPGHRPDSTPARSTPRRWSPTPSRSTSSPRRWSWSARAAASRSRSTRQRNGGEQL